MDLEKLTDRARGFLQAAQTIAVREHHQRIAPGASAKALLDDEQGMAAGLIHAAGGDGKAARREVDALVAKIPAVTGSGATSAPGIDGDTHPHARPGRAGRDRRPATATSRSSASCWRWRWPRPRDVGRRSPRPGVTPQNAQRRDRQAARRPHRRHAGRRGPLRRAEEICARPHRRRRATASSTR